MKEVMFHRLLTSFLLTDCVDAKTPPSGKPIVDFEVRQSSARWGMAMFSPPFSENDQEKGEVIGYLISNLDKYEPEDSESAMVRIEALRENNALTKCDISGIHFWDPKREQYIWRPDRRAQAIQLFCRWWGDGYQWPNNKSQDPFEGSKFEIYSWGR